MAGVETLLQCLTSFCDGAKKRDGAGFSKADAQDGARLSAMIKHGIGWTRDDLGRAQTILGKYARQASLGYCTDKKEAAKLERRIRAGAIQNEQATVEETPPFNYMHVSSMGTRAHLLIQRSPQPFDAFMGDINKIKKITHGVRKTRAFFSPHAVMTVNGRKMKIRRWTIDLNGTTQAALLELADKWEIVVDGALENQIDEEIDGLLKLDRFCLYHYGKRGRHEGHWAVFNFYRPHKGFAASVKKALPGLYSCSQRDDWNWFIVLDRRTAPFVYKLIQGYRIKPTQELCTQLMSRMHRI